VNWLVWLPLLVVQVAGEPQLDTAGLHRWPPVEPSKAVATMAVKPGFEIELMAAEPLVRDPIEICFDEDGRLYVVEMIDYSERRGEKPHLGRIRRLEDTNGDGHYDRSDVYADDLPWPTGVFCWGGGVFVAATPDIWFLKDTTGDGRADRREVVLTGFAEDYAPYETNRLNVQAMLNSFRWGLDNRIHGVTSFNGGRIRAPSRPAEPAVNVRGRDFAFDPRDYRLWPEAGGGQYGMGFDDAGTRFTCSNSDHARVFLYEARYAERNPVVALPPALQSIALDGPAAEVFRRSPDEPWRVIRTEWRVGGLVPGPIEGGGRASGYFTSASGLTIYRGDAWPPEFVGDLFVADCGSNLLHRKQTRRHGIEWIAERATDEQKTEFLASTDTWFRPVQLANAPDGTLWVIDMYREIIEHPWSLPPGLKEHLDLNAGNDRGRLYRIAPRGWQPRAAPRLSVAGTEELVRILAHPNAWHRETAARLLYERQDRANAVPALERLMVESATPLGRLHALYALDGQGALTVEAVVRAMSDPDERVRMHAVRLSERFLADSKGHDAAASLAALRAKAKDPSPRVRYQLAFTLGETQHPDRIKTLTELARQNSEDRWIRGAILSSLSNGALEVFDALIEGGAPQRLTLGDGQGEGMAECMVQLARIVGSGGREDEILRVLKGAERISDAGLGLGVVQALSEMLSTPDAPALRERMSVWAARAAALAQDTDAAEADRVRAIELLGGIERMAGARERITGLLVSVEPQEVQLAAIRALSRMPELDVAGELTQRWSGFTPRVREEVLRVLLARPARAIGLLHGIQDGLVPGSDLDATRIEFLQTHRDPDVRALAAKVLSSSPSVARRAVFEAFAPALELSGDAARGRELYMERCASCHRHGGEGYAVGPDLLSVRHAGKERLLWSIIDPNIELSPQYAMYEIEMVDGETHMGMLAEETSTTVTLRMAYGQERVMERKNIVRLRGSDRSMMPEELESGLDLESMADLLEFILAVE
jgi:putative membrane-bound dehydrogenase-like protein